MKDYQIEEEDLNENPTANLKVKSTANLNAKSKANLKVKHQKLPLMLAMTER